MEQETRDASALIASLQQACRRPLFVDIVASRARLAKKRASGVVNEDDPTRRNELLPPDASTSAQTSTQLQSRKNEAKPTQTWIEVGASHLSVCVESQTRRVTHRSSSHIAFFCFAFGDDRLRIPLPYLCTFLH